MARRTRTLAAALAAIGLAATPAAALQTYSAQDAGIAANPSNLVATYTATTATASTSQGWTQFLSVTCGTDCADPLGELSAAQQNWSALQAMGTTDYIGSAFNGTTLDASSLLAASRVVGASQVDNWLRTGATPDQQTYDMIVQALSYGAGYDVSNVTGVMPASNGGTSGTSTADYSPTGIGSSSIDQSMLTQFATANNSALGILSDGINMLSAAGNGSQTTCNQSIAKAQNANAQSFINNMMTLITGNGTGFSVLGGASVASGQRSSNGVFGSGCLDKLMQGNMDTLFSPPGLSSLVGQLGSMFGGMGGSSSGSSSGSSGGSNGCGNAPSVSTQIAQSFPQSIFSNSGGGFFPALGFSSGEGDVGSASIPLPSTSGATQGGFAQMFASNSTSGGSSGSYDSSGSSYGYGTTTYPGGTAGTTGSPTATPGGNTGYAAQGADPKVDSRLLQGHSITLPGNN